MAIGPIPGAHIGGATYTFQWDGTQLEHVVDRAAEQTMRELAVDIRAWFAANLHRWTGEMERMSYARSERSASGFMLQAGSESDHTWYHEVKYHPQLRMALDIFAPQMGPRLKAKLG